MSVIEKKKRKKRLISSMLVPCLIYAWRDSLRAKIASWRPMFPKQTHALNKTLATQVLTARLSCVIPVPNPRSRKVLFRAGIADADAPVEGGTKSGLSARTIPIPPTPTMVDMKKPVLVRSIRYQRTGFARASVADA